MELDGKCLSFERFLSGHAPFAPKPLHAPGAMVGDWKILAFLGRGGSGEVYRAENTLLGSVGALKVLVREDAKSKGRFRLEARLLSETTCATFPRFCAYGEADGRLYVVTELLEPMDLPSGDAAVAEFFEKVCAGVAELHRLGYIHRDIKPSNIMRRPSTGEPVLIDLGLAKASSDTPSGRNSTMSVVDGRAAGVGTPGYSAPEQFSGGAIAPTADIHALGILVNDCFSGNPPGPWARIVRRSTSSIPSQRYASVEQLVKAIRHRHRERWLAVGIALGLAAILYAVILLMGTGENDGYSMTRQTSHMEQPVSLMDMRISHEDMRKAFQDTSVEDVDTNIRSASWDELGETTLTNGVTVKKIWLDGRTFKVKEPVVLHGRQVVYVVGPGLLDCDISGSKEVSIQLARNAAVLNRTLVEHPRSGMMYSMRGESYLNFVNLKSPPDNFICNVIGGPSEIVRFGGPHSYREAREDEFRRAMEAPRRQRWRKNTSHDLRDLGIRDELKGF